MNLKIIRRSLGAIVFFASLITYYLTVQPSVSFWDCGEYLATAYRLQIPHPPGAPLFLLIARLFSMLPIAENIAFRMNLISVIASAAAVLILYLVIIKVIQNYYGKEYKTFKEGVVLYVSAAIGSLAFAFAYITWWNAVETEVYATNTFVFAAIVYLMLLWNERADQIDSEKFILLIAYLVGLSTSLRLMGALTTISIVMLIMFRKYVDDYNELKKTINYLLIHLGILLLLALILWGSQTQTTPPYPDDYKAFDTKFAMFMIAASAVFIGVFWKKLIHHNSIYVILFTGSVLLTLIYPGIVRYLPNLISNLSGGTNNFAAIIWIAIFLGLLSYGIYYSVKNDKKTLGLLLKSFLLIFLGFMSYGVIIIRSNLNPPINENAPSTFKELVTYLNREQYGEWPVFQRRYSTDENQAGIYTNYSSDLDFLWNYQMNHMMTRYILWNFAGRESWDQDSGVNVWPFNSIASIIGKLFGLRFAGEPSKSYFGIPFLIGLIGLYYHFKRDWKMASVFLVLFIMITYITAYYQNQQEPQPRERIKFYGTMCFMFGIWISIGLHNLIELLQQKVKNESIQKLAPVIVLGLGFVFIPLRMYTSNYHEQDRSKDWVPWDYAYNLLQSVAPNAVLFTNGDNDTFPLWYLQEVEGVRQDVRVACLSLINTPWYIKQLKYESPHGSMKVDMDITDREIDNIGPIRWEPQTIEIPVTPEDYKKFGITDTSITNKGKITFTMKNTLTFGNIKAIRNQDIAVLATVKGTRWKRPIYFATTCSDDSRIGLDDYLRLEGMAYRLVPFKSKSRGDFVDDTLMWKNMIEENPGYSKTYKPGFKYRGLNDSTIYFDDNHTRMLQNYRTLFLRLAYSFLDKNEKQKTIQVLNTMQEKMPTNVIPMDYRLMFDMSNFYLEAGDTVKYKSIARKVEQEAIKAMEKNPRNVASFYSPYSILLRIYDNLKEYEKAKGVLLKLQVMFPSDNSIKNLIIHYDSLSQKQKSK
ncbi:protein O-mannosyl-transferase family [Melioribacteraceae bacterium 4301-Me]|uniref:protein O-mannosyl-transferase family n=1 Tax=Pyranulibacter aquaticus TaxID=3163344 RepID=UPI00359B51B8